MSGETRIEQLDPNEPAGSEPVSEGDDQITGIKGAVLGSFPSLGSGQVTVDFDHLNNTGRTDFGESTSVLANWDFTFAVVPQAGIRINNNQPNIMKNNGGTDLAVVRMLPTDELDIGNSAFNTPINFIGTGLNTFNGDVQVDGDLTTGAITASDRIQFQNGLKTTPQSNLNPVAGGTGIAVRRASDNLLLGYLQVFGGDGVP